jgi:hypothetical protein
MDTTMDSQSERHILSIAVALIVAVVTAAAQTRTPPYLYLEVWSPSGIVRPGADGFITVANNERIQTRVCLKVPSVFDAFESLGIQASNQPPDYFKNRPPANVSLRARQIAAGAPQEAPVRIVSSGRGGNLTISWIDATFDILETPQLRQQHGRDFAKWMWDFVQTRGSAGLLQSMADKETYVTRVWPYYEEMYVNNPVGSYEITGRYAPSTSGNWKGELTTDTLKIRVIFNADFFDVMKSKF